MLQRIRLLFWRRQRLLAGLYLLGLSSFAAGLWAYRTYMPSSFDQGVVVALRNLAYRASFDEVDAARAEFAAGRDADAEKRLLLFLAAHRNTQPAQLMTHAVSDAHEELAEHYRSTGRLGRAETVLGAAVARAPLDYHLWYRLGDLRKGRGDLAGAAEALREAFRLTLVHPGVTNIYLAVLGDLNAYEEILWVDREYRHAVRRARPTVHMKAGVPRSGLQQSVLTFSEIPIEHGKYFRSMDVDALERGEDRRLALPREMLQPWTHGPGPLYVELRFQHIYDDLRVTGLIYRGEEGTTRTVKLDSDQVAYLHRAHSGAAYYAEIRTGLDPRGLHGLEIVYSCPETALGEEALAIIDKARANKKAQR